MGLLPVRSSSGAGSSSSRTGANGTDSVDGASSAGSGNGQGGGNTQQPSVVVRLRGGPCMVQAGGTVSFGDENATGSSCPCDFPAAVMTPAIYDPPDLLQAAIEELENIAKELASDLVELNAQEAASGLKK